MWLLLHLHATPQSVLEVLALLNESAARLLGWPALGIYAAARPCSSHCYWCLRWVGILILSHYLSKLCSLQSVCAC